MLSPIALVRGNPARAKFAAVWGAVCFRSSSERAVTDVRDGPLRWTFETNGTDSSRRLLQKSTRAGRGVGPWTAGRDEPPGRTFETNGKDSWRWLMQKFVRAGRGRPAVTGRREGLFKQTARIPGADCCKSPSERAVGAGRGRPAVTGRQDGLLKQTARIPGADCCRSSSERAVDGRPWRAAGRDFWNKRHGFLAPIVAEVRQSGPWEQAVDGRPWRAARTDFWNKRHGFLALIVAEVRQSGPWTTGRDGPPERTFETNGTDSWRRLLQKFVRAGRGRPAVTGRRRDFWNKRHGFLAPIVAEVRQSGPWEPAVDGRPWRAAGMYFWNKRHRFLAPIVSEFRQSGPWTACRDGPLGCTFETNGTDSWRRLFQNSVRAGRGRPVVTGRWDGLLKQMARLPYADCFKSQPDRVVDGRSWRAAGMDFWNKRRGFFTPIVAKVHQSGPWGRAVDGRPWRAAGMDFWNKRHGFLAPIVAEVRQSGPWERAVDGRPWRAAEMNFWNKRHGFLALVVSKVCQIGPCMLTKPLTMFISRNPIEIQWVSRK